MNKKRVDERSQTMFYCGPTIGAKYTYQNSEVTHVIVDLAKVKLLNSFPIVLICDTTYKTNKYCLSLLVSLQQT